MNLKRRKREKLGTRQETLWRGVTPTERLFQKIQLKDSCWIWTGNTTSSRGGALYGIIHWDGKNRRAHRIAYELYNGPIGAGLMVCHTCDTPLCINPDHLFLGKQNDNMADAKRKRRFRHGSLHYRSKLSADDVHNIRRLLANGISHRVIAKQFGVKHSSIFHIKIGKSWGHLDVSA